MEKIGFEGLDQAPQFKTTEDELTYLREQLRHKEELLKGSGVDTKKEDLATGLVEAYKAIPKENALHPDHAVSSAHAEAVVLKLAPEAHDDKMSEILSILMEHGIKNALDIASRMNDPHIDDDLHRLLVQYLSSYDSITGLKNDSELHDALSMKLFEVTVPNKEEKSFKEMISLMEQFFSGMQIIGTEKNSYRHHYTLEVAVHNKSEQIIFYTAVPREQSGIFEKLVLGLYSGANIREVTDDYNLFDQGNHVVGLIGKPSNNHVFTIKTYQEFDNDPVSVLINAFSKVQKEGEGLALQINVRPVGNTLTKDFEYVREALKRGEKMESILEGLAHSVSKEVKGWGSALWSVLAGEKQDGNTDKSEEEKEKEKEVDEISITEVTKKLESIVVETNIRVIASAQTESRAQELARTVESMFHQFTNSKGNGLAFETVSPKETKKFLHDFSYRLLDSKNKFALNLSELATLFHFPAGTKLESQIKESGARSASAPLEMGAEGISLGYNIHQGVRKEIHFKEEDRLRHFYSIGQTGVGKTQLFLNMIIQDIKNGKGCCFIDPHGSDINTILANIPPERFDDVIYFDPAYTARPAGLNFLEFDERYPEQKTLVVSELFSIFDKLFDMKAQGGAMFGQYFRNAALLVMEDPSSGNTLLEITRVLGDKEFRTLKLSRCKNPIVTEFWRGAEQTTGDQSLANFVPYISSKFDDFISNEIMRPVVLQEKSAFNFRKVMDEKKILLVNLSKGRLGERNANLIGLTLVGKLQMAALSRADSPNLAELPPFYVYIDEFQNVVTDSVASILAEARKYKLVLNITHQYLEQLPESIKGAVFGNVGSMGIFRIKYEDAKVVEPRLQPNFDADDVVKLDNMNCYMSMLVDGRPVKSFNMKMDYAPKGDQEKADALKQLSYMKFGRPREDVEEEIREKFMKGR